jgi:multiple sugar transport system substrate-binding protein
MKAGTNSMTHDRLTRRQVLYGSGVGAAATLAGCVGGGGSSGGNNASGSANNSSSGGGNQNEVHVLTDYSSQPWQQEWEQIASGFQDQTGIPLNVEYVGMQGSGEQRLLTLIQSGSPPEMYHGTMTQVADLVVEGRTIPVGDIISRLEEVNGNMVTKDPITIEQTPYLMPHGLYAGGTLNYRKDIYDDLGLSVPKTWDQLVQNAKAIDESDNWDERGFALAAQPAGKPGSDFANWVYNAGGRYFQWANQDQTRLELADNEAAFTDALNHMKRLAQYSPDPSSLNWAPTIEYWVGGRIAQTIMNNAWLAGPTYRAGATDIALNTEQALIPKPQRSTQTSTRGWALVDGSPILKGADNQQGAKQLQMYMYGSPQKQTDKLLTEPMRFLPPYEGVIDSDAYQSAEIFQVENGHFLELNRFCMNEIIPKLGTSELPSNAASTYTTRFPIDAQMVNQVIVQGRDVQSAYQEGRQKRQRRLKQGRERANLQ